MVGAGELWLLAVAEADEGDRDRNGDGDRLDVVPVIHDLADGSLTDLGLAIPLDAMGLPLPLLAVGETLIAFPVSEAAQGATDRNGDADADDLVWHVFDINTRQVTNTGLAAGPRRPAIGSGAVALVVQESAQGGQDLDGDATDDGLVLHIYDARTRLTTNVGRNVTSEVVFHDHAFAFTTDERSAGVDLNGDLDLEDETIFELYDLLFGGVREIPLAVRGRPLVVGVEDWFVLGDEFQMGADLNGDLDTADGVFLRVLPHLGAYESIGLSSLDSLTSTTRDMDLALAVQEIDGLDHNGDGDRLDSVAVLYDAAHAQTRNSGLAIDPARPLVFAGDWLAFTVDEAAEERDLNGDGDELDSILHVMERATGAVLSLDVEVFAVESAADRILFARDEADTGNDWNGDGDAQDRVEFAWDPVTGLVTNTRLAGTGHVLGADGDHVLLLASEAQQGEDLNGDRDRDDFVYVLHDLLAGTNRSLRAATEQAEAGLVFGGRGMFLVSEAGQARDLNGDGDREDHVVHTLGAP